MHGMWRVLSMLVLDLALMTAGHAVEAEDRPTRTLRLHEAAMLARVELALDALGYRIDPPDGLPDGLTSRALACFRRDARLPAGLPVDGHLATVLEAAVELRAVTHRALAAARRAAEERLVQADLSAKSARAPFAPAGEAEGGRRFGAALLPD